MVGSGDGEGAGVGAGYRGDGGVGEDFYAVAVELGVDEGAKLRVDGG